MPVLSSLTGANQEIDLKRKFEEKICRSGIWPYLQYSLKRKELTHPNVTRDLETTLYLGWGRWPVVEWCRWWPSVQSLLMKALRKGLAAPVGWDPREAAGSASSQVQGSLREIEYSYGEQFGERSCPWEGGILQHGCHILEPSVDDLWQEWWLYVVVSWHRGQVSLALGFLPPEFSQLCKWRGR